MSPTNGDWTIGGMIVVAVSGALGWFGAALASRNAAVKRLDAFEAATRAREERREKDARAREEALRLEFDGRIAKLEERNAKLEALLGESREHERRLSEENATLRVRVALLEARLKMVENPAATAPAGAGEEDGA